MEEIQPQFYVLFHQAWDGAQAVELQGKFEVADAAEEMSSGGDDVSYVVQTADDDVKLFV